MKKFLILLLALFTAVPLPAQHEDILKIMRLSTPAIRIDGKDLKEGDTFRAGARITWEGENQSMECKNLSTGMPYRFSKKQFESKGTVTSVKEYLLRSAKASTRDVESLPPFSPGKNKDRYAEKRCALVFGNSNYAHLSYLRNPVNDAADIASTLRDLGFDAMEVFDASYTEMRTALNVFATRAQGYDAAIIYYCGHGIQEEGINYLVPIDCPLEAKSELRFCVAAADMVDKLDETGCQTRILILDACRNVKTSWSRSSASGLASMEGTPGMVIAFSTRNGRTAEDGDALHSPFTAAMLENLPRGSSFSEMMADVARSTYDATAHRQFPVTIGSLMTDFRFNPSASGTPVPVQAASPVTQQAPAPAQEAKNTENQDLQFAKGMACYKVKDMAGAFRILLPLAEAGYVKAYFPVAEMYHTGRGVKKDRGEAEKWYQKAADLGDDKAKNILRSNF